MLTLHCLSLYNIIIVASILQNMSLNQYAFPPKLGQVEMTSSKPLTYGCLVDHFHLNVCIMDYEWIHSEFLVEIGGLEWMGVVHGGIIVDTLPRVPNHSSIPLSPLGWNGVFPTQCWVECQVE